MKIIFQLNIIGEKRSCKRKYTLKKKSAIEFLTKLNYDTDVMILN